MKSETRGRRGGRKQRGEEEGERHGGRGVGSRKDESWQRQRTGEEKKGGVAGSGRDPEATTLQPTEGICLLPPPAPSGGGWSRAVPRQTAGPGDESWVPWD